MTIWNKSHFHWFTSDLLAAKIYFKIYVFELHLIGLHGFNINKLTNLMWCIFVSYVHCANMQYNIISIPKSFYSLCYFCLPPLSNLTSLWICVVSSQQRTLGIYLLFLYRGHCSKSPLVMKWSIPHRTNSLIHSWIKVHLWLWPDDHVLGSACGPKGKRTLEVCANSNSIPY